MICGVRYNDNCVVQGKVDVDMCFVPFATM